VHSATIDRVPKRLAVAAVLLVAALVGGACSSESANAPKAPLAFCQAAARYDDRVSRNAKIDEQIRLVQRMVDTAPAKIKANAQTFVDALRQVETDTSVKDDPRVKRAVENVNRYAAQGCGFYKQQGGGGI
jgi:negative regulator of sigma E activity